MNYLTKKNFGIPAGILAAISVLLGLGLYNSLSLIWVTLVFTAAVFLFDFDEVVKSNLKQALSYAFYGRLADIFFSIFRSILNWFSEAQYSSGSVVRGVYKVFDKILTVADNLVGFVFLLLFAQLLYSAVKGKAAKTSPLTIGAASGKETVTCPKCGESVDKDAAFCTKCGNKLD